RTSTTTTGPTSTGSRSSRSSTGAPGRPPRASPRSSRTPSTPTSHHGGDDDVAWRGRVPGDPGEQELGGPLAEYPRVERNDEDPFPLERCVGQIAEHGDAESRWGLGGRHAEGGQT